MVILYEIHVSRYVHDLWSSRFFWYVVPIGCIGSRIIGCCHTVDTRTVIDAVFFSRYEFAGVLLLFVRTMEIRPPSSNVGTKKPAARDHLIFYAQLRRGLLIFVGDNSVRPSVSLTHSLSLTARRLVWLSVVTPRPALALVICAFCGAARTPREVEWLECATASRHCRHRPEFYWRFTLARHDKTSYRYNCCTRQYTLEGKGVQKILGLKFLQKNV